MCIFGNSSKVFQMKLYFFIYFRYSWANSQPSSFHCLFLLIYVYWSWKNWSSWGQRWQGSSVVWIENSVCESDQNVSENLKQWKIFDTTQVAGSSWLRLTLSLMSWWPWYLKALCIWERFILYVSSKFFLLAWNLYIFRNVWYIW